jgi:hypothetical protein
MAWIITGLFFMFFFFFPSNIILSMCGHIDSTCRQAHLLALSSHNMPSEWSCTLSISLQEYNLGLD